MSQWFRRVAGGVGVVAGAALLLGAGTAPVPASGPAVMDPLPVGAEGLPETAGEDPVPQVPDALRHRIDGPNMIGDDFVDQAP